MNEITIVIVPDSDVGAAVCSRVQHWTHEGLVAPSLWSTAALVSESGDLRGVRLRPDQADIDLTTEEPQFIASLFGKRLVDSVRLVAVHLVSDDGSTEPPVASVAPLAAEYLRGIIGPATSLITTNIVVPMSASTQVSRQAMQVKSFDHNLVIAPENRSSPRHPDQGLRTTDEYVAHAAFHIALVAGMFRGQGSSPLAQADNGSVALDPAIARGFARAIIAPSFLPHLVRATLVNRTEWPVPDKSVDNFDTTKAIDPHRIVRELLLATRGLRDGELTFRRRTPMPGPTHRGIGLWAALRLMLAALWTAVRRAPSELRARIERKATSAATHWVQRITGLGEGSLLVPTFGGRLPDEVRSVESIASEADRVADFLAGRGTPKRFIPAAPDVWATLRGMSFALIDGGTLPKPFLTPRAAERREIVCRPDFVAIDPEQPAFRFSKELQTLVTCVQLRSVTVDVSDPHGVLRAHQTLDVGRARLVEEDLKDNLARAEFLAAEAAIAAAAPPTPDDAVPEPPAPGATSDEEFEARRAAREKQREYLDDAASELDRWVEQYGSGLWWQLGMLLGGQLEAAKDSLVAAATKLRELGESQLDEAGETKAISKRLRRWFGAIGVSFLAAALLSGLFRAFVLATLPIAAATGVFLLVAVTVASAWGYLKYCRDMFALEYKLDQHRHREEEMIAELQHCLHEVQRLARRYIELQDWSEIIGRIVHAPFGRDTVDVEVDETVTVDESMLPSSFIASRGTPAPEKVNRLGQIFMREMFTAGWLSEAYLNCLQRAIETLDENLGIVDAGLSPDNDTDDALVRRQLAAALRDGTATGREREEQLAKLRDFCEQRRSSEILGGVEFADEVTGLVEHLSVGSFLEDLLQGGESYVSSRLLALANVDHRITSAVAWAPIGEVETVGESVAVRPFTPAIDATKPYIVIALLYEQTDQIAIPAHAIAGPADAPERPSPSPRHGDWE